MTSTEDGHVDPHAFDSYWPFLMAVGVAVALTGVATHPVVFAAGFLVVIYSVINLAAHSEGLPKFKSRFQDLPADEHLLGRTSTAKMGMWMFLISEVLFFTGLIGTGMALRVRSDWWGEPGEYLNVPLTAVNTFLLICSSMTMVEALRGAEIGDNRRMRLALLGTLLIGITFVSIQVVEYTQLLHEGGHDFVPVSLKQSSHRFSPGDAPSAGTRRSILAGRTLRYLFAALPAHPDLLFLVQSDPVPSSPTALGADDEDI